MPFFHWSVTLLLLLGLFVVEIWASSILLRRRRKAVWHVASAPVYRWLTRTQYTSRSCINASSVVEVRLVRRNNENILLDQINVRELDFDDRLHEATAAAEQKAAVLNALEN
jgi:hypothetical protein